MLTRSTSSFSSQACSCPWGTDCPCDPRYHPPVPSEPRYPPEPYEPGYSPGPYDHGYPSGRCESGYSSEVSELELDSWHGIFFNYKFIIINEYQHTWEYN